MDVRIINPFLAGAVRVLTTMAMMEPVPGKPFINEDQYAKGIVSAIIPIGGDASGSMSLTFTEPCIKAVVRGLLGIVGSEINEYIEDAVGELTNMICGDARERLKEQGFSLKAGIPVIVKGENHRVEHLFDGPRLAVPFETPAGQFMVEVVFFSHVVQLAS